MPVKQYLKKSVLDATFDRLQYLFDNFDKVIISFSGGKDSGLMLQLAMDYALTIDFPKDRLFIYYQNNESNTQATNEFVDEMMDKYADRAQLFHFCQPFALRNSVSSYEMWWYPFDPEKKDAWISQPPDKPYVYTMDNNILEGYWKYKSGYHEHAYAFGRWVRDKCAPIGGTVVQLVGLRADESLQRYSAVVNKVDIYKGQKWITTIAKDVYSAMPIYDWTMEDVWTGHARFKYRYNKIYDLMYRAGVPVGSMRVASFFNDAAKSTLNMLRVLEPQTWARAVNRVAGANFAAIYSGTKGLGKVITLPKRFKKWREYEKFLLSTLPQEMRDHYMRKFIFSVKFWNKTGAGMDEEQIAKLQKLGFHLKFNGTSPYSKGHRLRRVCILGATPNDMDAMGNPDGLPSVRRRVKCILRNDTCCLSMGFGLTAMQQKRVNLVKAAGNAAKKALDDEPAGSDGLSIVDVN